MITFCKNTLHAFLGTRPLPPPPPPSPGDARKPVNLLESTTVPKKDSGISGVGSGRGGARSVVDGLSSCTESLGFESSEQMEETIHESATTARRTRQRREAGAAEETEKREFPPVLSSLRGNGGHHSTSFLKPVREDGRLVLTPVTIDRKEVFLTSRQDGRLRLQFTKSEEEKQDREWRKIAPAVPSGREESGSRRCYEPKRYRNRCNRQHELWNQQCVTSR